MMPPHLKASRNPQNRNPHKPPAQPCRSTQCRHYHTCCTLQRQHLTLQWPMAYHKAGHSHLLTLWFLSAASSSGKLQIPTKPHPPLTTCPALPQHPVQASLRLLYTAKAALELAMPHDMPRAGQKYSGRAMCAVVTEHCLLIWKTPKPHKTAPPTNHLPSPAAAPSAGCTTPVALKTTGV